MAGSDRNVFFTVYYFTGVLFVFCFFQFIDLFHMYLSYFFCAQTKAMLEERNNSLVEQVHRLKEELRNAENRCNTLDTELRRLQSQHMEVTHKLSFAEAQLQLIQKVYTSFTYSSTLLRTPSHQMNSSCDYKIPFSFPLSL